MATYGATEGGSLLTSLDGEQGWRPRDDMCLLGTSSSGSVDGGMGGRGRDRRTEEVTVLLEPRLSRGKRMRRGVLDVLAQMKLKLMFTICVMSLLLLGVYFFSAGAEDATEPGADLYGVGASAAAEVEVDLDKPTAYFKLKLDLPPVGHAADGNATTLTVRLWQVQEGVASPAGAAWVITLEGEAETVKRRLDGPLQHFDANAPGARLYFRLTTTHVDPIGVRFHMVQLYAIAAYQVLFAAVILVGVYVFIVFELLHRTIAAMLGSFITLAVLAAVDERPDLNTIVAWIEYETVCLLFGMMVMVGIFSTTGFFEWAAVKAYKASQGDMLRLVIILCMFTAFISAFLDNVTTVLLLTPVTVQLCSVLAIDPVPILIAEVVFSNIGGTATAIGDPPNVIIVSHEGVKKSGIGFLDFTLHLAPGAILAVIAVYFFTRYQYKHTFDCVRPATAKEIEVEIWRKTLRRMPHDTESPEEQAVRARLMEHIAVLEEEVAAEAADVSVMPVDIDELERKYQIHDMALFVNCSITLSVVIFLFFLQSVAPVNLNLAWIAILGALTLLIVTGVHDIEEVLEKVEWGTLLFFASLFILMEGLGELGLITYIGDLTASLIKAVPSNARLAVALLLILWISALVSAFIDNIPYTTAMIPVVLQLGQDDALGLPLRPLVWALAFGTCLGGNGTLIGASANVVTAGLSQQAGYPISFNRFFRTGFPAMLISVFTVSIYLLLIHVAFGLE